MKHITLKTGVDGNANQQKEKLSEIQTSLAKRNVILEIIFSESLHDREIRWVLQTPISSQNFTRKITPVTRGQHRCNIYECKSVYNNSYMGKLPVMQWKQQEWYIYRDLLYYPVLSSLSIISRPHTALSFSVV